MMIQSLRFCFYFWLFSVAFLNWEFQHSFGFNLQVHHSISTTQMLQPNINKYWIWLISSVRTARTSVCWVCVCIVWERKWYENAWTAKYFYTFVNLQYWLSLHLSFSLGVFCLFITFQNDNDEPTENKRKNRFCICAPMTFADVCCLILIFFCVCRSLSRNRCFDCLFLSHTHCHRSIRFSMHK